MAFFKKPIVQIVLISLGVVIVYNYFKTTLQALPVIGSFIK